MCQETFNKYPNELKKLNFISDIIERENERAEIKKSFSEKINICIEKFVNSDYKSFLKESDQKKSPIESILFLVKKFV